MKIRSIKHRRIVTPWIRYCGTGKRRPVFGQMSYRLSRSVLIAA